MNYVRCFLFLSVLFAVIGCGDDDRGTIPPDGGRVDGAPTTCPTGRTSCGGACLDTQTSPANCGACGNACLATETCSAGSCVEPMMCPMGQQDCGSGCTDTSTDSMHCGRCGNPCDADDTCMDGSCQPAACASDQMRCGASCVDTQTDSANCGTCGTTCATSEMCTAGSCVSACPSGQTPCTVVEDMRMMTVCVDTATDASHCGTCNNACPMGQSCGGGTCNCPMGTTSCSGSCVDTSTDLSNCGMCGNACPMGQTCNSGTCGCSGGLTSCGGACVNTSVDNANCGMCGRTCSTPSQTCVSGTCMSACGMGQVMCSGMCVDLMTNPSHCGMCGMSCGTSVACVAGLCRPGNDVRAAAIPVTLPEGGGEATIMGSTTGATRDGPSISGCSANGPNVWYAVTLPARGVLWIDTAGSSYDTAVFVTTSGGSAVSVTGGTTTNPGLCNDDCCTGRGDFTSRSQSCAGGALNAGTYHISVGGFGATSTGNFTLHVQFLPDVGYLYATRLASVGTTFDTSLVSTSEAVDMCAGGLSSRSGEDMRWFASCGMGELESFSLCSSDGGTYQRESLLGSDYDPVMYVRSGQTGTEVACNDDGGATFNCRGTGGDSANFGSRIWGVAVPRGVNAVFIDSRGTGGGGMNYSMRYQVSAVP